MDGESFLAESASGAIHHLNPLASALWRILRQGATRDGLTALVRAAYPEVPEATVERDIAAILADFDAKGLIAAEARGRLSPQRPAPQRPAPQRPAAQVVPRRAMG